MQFSNVVPALVKWFPSGTGIFLTVNFLQNQEWMQAAISSVFSAVWPSLTAFFESYWKGFKEKLEEGGQKRGEDSATWLLEQTDQLPKRIRWMLSNFQKKYYLSLTDKYLKIETEGFNVGLYSLNLENVFVPLKVANEIQRNIPRGIPTLKKQNPHTQQIWDFLVKSTDRPKRMAILASPGAGKSTLLRHITLTYVQRKAQKQYKALDLIPVLLRLRDVGEQLISQTPPSLSELICSQINKKLDPKPHWFESQMESGKCLVMLDGLDEVTNNDQRSTVSRWVKRQMENYPQSTFLLTSRPHGYDSELFGGQVNAVLEIQPFTLDEIKQFIEKWYLQTEVCQQRRNTEEVRQAAQKKAEDLYEALLQNPSIRRMASNPLLVTMIATVHYLGNALPGRRVELYKEICDVLLGRRLLARKSQLPLKANQNQSILQALALNLMQRETGTPQFTLAETAPLIQEKLDQVPNNSLTPQQWLEIIRDDVGLLVEKELNRYEFAHLSFQEYLAATEIKHKNLEKLLIQNFHQPRWKETIRLYAAQSNATQLIQAAIHQPTVDSLSLANDCLDASSEVEFQIAEQLRNRLEAGLESYDPEIAKLAAQVSLKRRLERLLRIDEYLDIDRTFITCAEYQLFVYDTVRSGEASPCPYHWSEGRFSAGGAKKPITEITLENALNFIKWLNLETAQLPNNEKAFYRLPTITEALKTPAAAEYGTLSSWSIGENQPFKKGIRIIKVQLSPQYVPLANYLAAGEMERADRETTAILLKLTNRERNGVLDKTSLENVPCESLQTIDALWQSYYNIPSGFNAQVSIWEKIGGNPLPKYLPCHWYLQGSESPREMLSALAQRLMNCHFERLAIERSLLRFHFEVVTVNRKGEMIQRQTQSACYFTEQINSIALEMVYIPGGSFKMGSPESEKDSRDYEYPLHQVDVPALFMSKYPVTQAQWRAIAALEPIERELNSNPSYFTGDDRPVENVSWYDAVEFCDRLFRLTGRLYRLPSEAEWEYACRAGTTTPFYFGETITGKLANYNAASTYAAEPKGEYRPETTPVGQFPPNTFGLYDMHGNVWEWCADDWHENYQGAPTDGSAWLNKNDNRSQNAYTVLRGGSWSYDPDVCRSAYRVNCNSRVDHYDFIGFRVVCGVG